MPTFERYQGAFISEREIKAVVNFIKENNECYYDEELAAYLDRAVSKKEDESEYSVPSDQMPQYKGGEFCESIISDMIAMIEAKLKEEGIE